jgi:glycosyltransferase involved in cell wall biosynthesis
VGEGSLKGELQRELSNWNKDSTISMPGFLEGDQIKDIYASTKVLISTAPKEGYGLTLREAALSGVHVIARESKGSLETKDSFPSRIETFSNLDDAVGLIQNRLESQGLGQSTVDMAFQLEVDVEGLDRLTKSWVDN